MKPDSTSGKYYDKEAIKTMMVKMNANIHVKWRTFSE